MSVPDRKEVVRIDCKKCGGKGYVNGQAGQESCPVCGGLGMREREVDFCEESEGVNRSKEDLQDMFGEENPTNRFDPDSIGGKRN